MFKFGVDTFIWSEVFTERDLWIVAKAKELGFQVLDIAIAHPDAFHTEEVKAEANRVGIPLVTTTLNKTTNIISPEPEIRMAGVKSLKTLVDINYELGASILAGVSYAAWGYLTYKPRTRDEWNWSVDCMREVAEYAKSKGELVIAVECVNRFETHFLNIAEDAVQYCKDIASIRSLWKRLCIVLRMNGQA